MEDFKKITELAGKGDTETFAKLYSMVYKDMYHTALYNLRNEHDACDAVSEAVIDAFQSIGSLRDIDAFKSWIMKILFAKIKRKQKEYINSSGETLEDIQESEGFGFESSELRNALETLDDESRALLSLSVLGGYRSDEIAAIYGMKSSTVRSRLSRIKEKLRLQLAL
ncbi:MAG: RNA polymerase sigma factor [Porcipelethomonas sp.]